MWVERLEQRVASERIVAVLAGVAPPDPDDVREVFDDWLLKPFVTSAPTDEDHLRDALGLRRAG